MKLTSEKGLKSIDTLIQDQRLHTKEFFNLWSESSSLPNTNIFLSFHTIQNIHKGTICHAFYELYPQMTHAIQEEFPSLNKKESKTHQRGRKTNSKEPESLHNEEDGDPPSLLQRGQKNTYFPKSAPSFEVGPKLRLSPKKPPKQRKPP